MKPAQPPFMAYINLGVSIGYYAMWVFSESERHFQNGTACGIIAITLAVMFSKEQR